MADANAYAGTTAVSAGTLVAANATGSATGTGTGPLVVAGVLAGTGSVAGPVTLAAGARITAGSGPTAADTTGLLTTAAQTWNGSAGYIAKLAPAAAAGHDELVLSGLTVNATAGSPFTITLLGQGGSANPTSLSSTTPVVLAVDALSDVIVFAAALARQALVLATTAVTVPVGTVASLSELDTGSAAELVVESVVPAPEPTSVALLALAVAAPLGVVKK